MSYERLSNEWCRMNDVLNESNDAMNDVNDEVEWWRMIPNDETMMSIVPYSYQLSLYQCPYILISIFVTIVLLYFYKLSIVLLMSIVPLYLPNKCRMNDCRMNDVINKSNNFMNDVNDDVEWCRMMSWISRTNEMSNECSRMTNQRFMSSEHESQLLGRSMRVTMPRFLFSLY